ncbi:MAG: MBL fold metallo-hydrolase [Lentisphaeria bacterium]|nr:MBL fold metallo-hydrolase [Lentisphaeria bacterium]
MKKFILQLLSLSLGLSASGVDFSQMRTEKDTGKREKLQDQMQLIVDKTLKAEFETFDDDPDRKTNNPVLKYYDQTLDHLLIDIPATQVNPGTVVIWYLYNMGFVIKTPTACFGVDIHHRRAVKLAPLLDFIAVTHNHNDHYDIPLLRTINADGKFVISNFFPARGYTKATSATHTLNGITIHCGEADHNPTLRNFVMPMEFVCPTGDKNFVFFTSGDIFHHDYLKKQSETIHLYAVHPRCGMKPVEAAKKLNPDLTLIVHLLEMGHEYNRWRWPFQLGREEVANFRKDNLDAYVPVWGEKLLWDGKKINVCQ